jgi:acyl-ACP thioesterase
MSGEHRLGKGLARDAADPGPGPAGMLDPGIAGQDDRPVAGVDNGYVAGYRVRFDEAGADGMIRTGSLLRYAQDIAWRHSEGLGFDRRWYTERGRWWVVRSVDLEVLRGVPMGTLLRLATAVIGHRRIWARRRGEFRTAGGELVAVATVDWVILDERGRVLRIPPDFGVSFPNPELQGEILRVQLPPPPADAGTLELLVRPQDLDPMGHVNNAVYLDWIEEATAHAGYAARLSLLPRRIAIEYLASAEPGDRLTATAWAAGGRWWVQLRRSDDGKELVRASLG